MNALLDMIAQQNRETSARPDMRAQRLELLQRFAAYQRTYEFTSGDLVAEKHGHVLFNQDHAVMFWRWLNQRDPQDIAIIRDAIRRMKVNRVDCMVAIAEGGSIVFHPADAAQLRPLNDEERAELDLVLRMPVQTGVVSPQEGFGDAP